MNFVARRITTIDYDYDDDIRVDIQSVRNDIVIVIVIVIVTRKRFDKVHDEVWDKVTLSGGTA